MWGSDIGNMTLGRLNMNVPIAALSAEDRIVVVADVFGSIWISHDNGNNFVLQHDSALGEEFTAVLVESYASVWMASVGSVYRSFDGGKSQSQSITLYSVADYEILDIAKSHPDGVVFFSDINGMGISCTDEDVIQRVIESATASVSFPPNIIHQDGILYIGGEGENQEPVLKMSLDGGHNWMNSLQLVGMHVFEDEAVVMPAGSGCGVVWVAVYYFDQISEEEVYVICDIYRSVYYGLPNTWTLEWRRRVDVLGEEDPYVFIPTDIAATSPNNCTVVGLWTDWDDAEVPPHLYAVELHSCED
jgi:hypothetical protein